MARGGLLVPALYPQTPFVSPNSHFDFTAEAASFALGEAASFAYDASRHVENLWARMESNHPPPFYKNGALTSELLAQIFVIRIVLMP